MAAPISGATGTRFPAVPAPAVPGGQAADAGAAATRAPDTVNVPDIVEDRRTDAVGNVVSRYYVRGRLLGKVSLSRNVATFEVKVFLCQLVDLFSVFRFLTSCSLPTFFFAIYREDLPSASSLPCKDVTK